MRTVIIYTFHQIISSYENDKIKENMADETHAARREGEKCKPNFSSKT